MSEKEIELVKINFDGQDIEVPSGTNLIDVAKSQNTEVPHYCYHPDLSAPGNCRMCQMEVEGAPKLMIGCCTNVRDGMVVKSHKTSQKVKDTQSANLELILINHPMDCTVCDQAGHCKLQDYHYEYNAKNSRFIEQKVNKPKAKSLGPTVILDAERCIMCTRCIRFCDEITETSELGMINRGDKSEIDIHPDFPLNNELSGTVVDLCPVGALTHKKWRFNTRIWYTDSKDSICTGCSKGCNVKVHTRDDQIVQVKANYNEDVNKEWLCDYGRYGLEDYDYKNRVDSFYKDQKKVERSVLNDVISVLNSESVIILDLSLSYEELFLIKNLITDTDITVSVINNQKELSKVEKILMSSDLSANIEAFKEIFNGYERVVEFNEFKKENYDKFKNIIIIGDNDKNNLNELSQDLYSFIANKDSALFSGSRVVIPVESVLEKTGIYKNTNLRYQYKDKVLNSKNSLAKSLEELLSKKGNKEFSFENDRELTLKVIEKVENFQNLKIKDFKKGVLIEQ